MGRKTAISQDFPAKTLRPVSLRQSSGSSPMRRSRSAPLRATATLAGTLHPEVCEGARLKILPKERMSVIQPHWTGSLTRPFPAHPSRSRFLPPSDQAPCAVAKGSPLHILLRAGCFFDRQKRWDRREGRNTTVTSDLAADNAFGDR